MAKDYYIDKTNEPQACELTVGKKGEDPSRQNENI